MRSRIAFQVVLSFVVVLVLGTCGPGGREARAALPEYRSPEWQVMHSPLVLVGEIEKVEPGRVARNKAQRDLRSGVQSPQDMPQPSVATVRILRILKGKYPHPQVRIGSGPIRWVGEGESHVALAVGQQSIFILPSYPKDGNVALAWEGSIRPLTDMELIESRITRAAAYRDEFLEQLRTEEPQDYNAAAEIAEEMRELNEEWIADEEDKQSHNDSTAFDGAVESLARRLVNAEPEAIRGALAMDWLSDKPQPWYESDVWHDAVRKMAKAQPEDLVDCEKERIEKLLKSAGVTEDRIARYLASLRPEDYDDTLAFPPVPPRRHHPARPAARTAAPVAHKPVDEELTTDFVLRYHHFDRGAMLAAYAGDFSAEVLGELDPKRVKPIVASLYHSNDQRLQWLAAEAIRHSPGNDFSDIVLDEMVHFGQDGAWHALVHVEHDREASARLAAMIDDGQRRFTTRGAAQMWDALRRGECFEPVCVEKALTALEELERSAAAAREPQSGRTGPSDDRSSLLASVQHYLAAARLHRQKTQSPGPTAAEQRKWFQENPK